MNLCDAEDIMYQTPVPGRNTEISLLRSPSKSNRTGRTGGDGVGSGVGVGEATGVGVGVTAMVAVGVGVGPLVFIGGREFGAETMAVAGEMMSPARKVAGVVLVDPGPTAFFEVEPPALALRPTGPSDWSTRAAVTGLDRPTLCVSHAAETGSLLCRSLAGRGQATLARTGADAAALANTIARFILRR